MKKGLEPAFPVNDLQNRSLKELNSGAVDGISRRLFIATQLTSGMLTNTYPWNIADIKQIIEQAYKITDELLNQEQ